MTDQLNGRRKRGAFSKRAALRKRQMEDYEPPATEGPKGGSENLASLIWMGAPESAMARGAKFAPKGLRLARKGTENVGKYVMRVLKPVLSKGAKAASKVK